VDRLLGAVFGLLIGLQVMLILMLLVSRYFPEGGEYVQASRSAPLLISLLERLEPLLPGDFASSLQRYGDMITTEAISNEIEKRAPSLF